MLKYSLLYTLLLLTHSLFAQTNYVAIITEPQIGTQESAQNLIEVVNHISKNSNVSNVVVLGNITAHGKFDEFIWAQEILDGLNISYSVIGGDKDYLLSEGNGSEIKLIWGNDQIIYPTDNFNLAFINTIQPEFSKKRYINVETVSVVDEKLSRTNSDRTITFSYYPINLAENSYDFTSKLLNKKTFSFVTREEKSSDSKSLFEGLYLKRKDGWGYLLVSSKQDTLLIQQILSEDIKKKIKPDIVKRLFLKPNLAESKKDFKNIKSLDILWTKSLNRTSRLGSVITQNKILTVFKNGLIICLDDNGFEKWEYELNKRIVALPKIDNDLLVISTFDGDIYTINVNTGNPYQTIGIGERITSGVSVIEIEEASSKSKAVVVGTQYGNLYCYDLLTLNPIWTQQLSESGNSNGIISQISYSNNKIFFLDTDGTLYCFSGLNGMLIWKIPASKGGWKVSSSLVNWRQNNIVAKGNLIYLIDSPGNLYCVDALLGTPKWELKNIGSNGQIILGEKDEFILPTKKNTIVFVSIKTGKVTKEIVIPINDDETISDINLIGDKIIAGCSDGWVHGVRARQKVEKIYRKNSAPIISINNVNGNCLITDYDGNITLLNLLNK